MWLGDLIKSLKNHGELQVKPIIIGHSMGGLLAQKIATEYHPWINGIILVASAPPRGIPIMSWDVAVAMIKHCIPLIFNRPLKIDRKTTFNLLLGGYGDDEISYPDEDWYDESQEQIFQKLVPESPRVAKQLAFSRIPVNERKINCPTLVVAGTRDKICPLPVQLKIREKYCFSDYSQFEHGHMLMLERGQEEIISKIFNWVLSRCYGCY